MTTGKSPKWRDNSSAGCQWLEGPHIFLCHSGAQKDFTHQLWVDLVGQHRHTFFDIESLPHARYFPGVVFNAAANCKLVLSEEFFTGSIWPMLELQIILHAINSGKNPQLKLFPLFYRISTQYMKDPTNERRWLQKWQEWVTTDSRLNITACTKALSVLKSYSGLVYQPGIAEVNYRRMVVDAICEIVPPFITADLTYVQGANRICQEIISKLNQLRCEESKIAPDTNFLAVYGKHGIGKTTLRKILCNYFRTQAGWRVCHIQVGNGQDHLAQQKLALKHLTGASQSLLEAVTNNDEGQDLLGKRLNKQKAFLALDDACTSESSVHSTRMFLRLVFSKESLVLVTACSREDLLEVIGYDISEKCFRPPNLTEEEAVQILLNRAIPNCNFTSLPKFHQQIIRCCASLCKIKHTVPSNSTMNTGEIERYHYHPSSLLEMGVELGGNSNTWFNKLEQMEKIPEQNGVTIRKIFATIYRALGKM